MVRNVFVLLALVSACAHDEPKPAAAPVREPAREPAKATEPEPLAFAPADDTQSPSPARAALADPVLDRCGVPDERLSAAAELVAKRHLAGQKDPSRASELLRLVGEPHPWPRIWIASGSGFVWKDLAPGIDKWRSELPAVVGQRRCGRALVTAGTASVAIMIAVDALADLAPLTMRARTGSWLTVEGAMLVPSGNARVVVVGPDGRPRAVPTNVTKEGRIRARFAPDRPGRFSVQMLADVGQGPRPVLEALVFADVAPFEDAAKAPGEAAAGDTNDTEALARMVHALRIELGLPALRRDPRLDTLARAHSQRMLDAGRVGHDVGAGDPRARLEQANLDVRKAGENVAHAETVVHAHRALYASPSHRDNLIHRDFDRLGVSVLTGPDGTVWVTELFAQ